MLKILHYIISPCKGVEEGFTVTCVFCLGARMHGRGTRGAAPASDAARRGTRRPTRLPARRTAFGFFFFFSRIRAKSARFAPMRLDSCRIGFDSHQTGLIRPKSGHIGHIRSYRPAVDTAETGRKTAEICRNRP